MKIRNWKLKIVSIIRWCWATLPRRIVCVLVIASIIMSSIWFLLLKPNPAEAGWFDEDWLYRRAVPITNNTTAETNRYVSVTIDTSDTTKFQADCGDLRFTKLDGALMKYYISSGCLSASTVVHVLFDTLQAGLQTIYYYYGNPSAENGFEGTDFSTVASNYTVGSIGSEEKGNGPILYLRFDEGYGTTTYDSSGQNNDGTITGATWSDSGKFGKALSFDGNDHVEVPYNPNSVFPDITVSLWVNQVDFLAIRGLIGHFNFCETSGESSVYINTNGTVGVNFRTTVNNNLTTTQTISTNTWYHIVFTFASGSQVIYINGVPSASATVVGSLGSNGRELNIGKAYVGGGTYSKGLIDEVKIYPYARTAAQVKRDYNQGFAVKMGAEYTLPSGLVGYWKMDEGSGSTVYDSSSATNDGTITGATWKGSAECKYGSCLSFDGNGDYVEKISPSNMPSNVGTISLWAKAVNWNAVAYVIGTNSDKFLIYTENQGLYLYIGATAARVTSASNWLIPNKFHHIVATWNTDTDLNYIFIDGVNRTSNTYATNAPSGITNLRIGTGGTSTYYFNGLIDNVMIYDRALSAGEIADLYAIGQQEKKAVGYWKMDEGYGTTAEDSSGRGNDLTFSGSTESYTMSGKFGRAWDGDGAKWLSRADDPDFDFTASEDFSISMWFKSDSATPGSNEYLINKGPPSAAGYYIYMDTGGDVIFGIDDDTNDDKVGDVGSDYYDNTWHHLTAIKTGTTSITLYVDGKELSSDTSLATTGSLANSALLYLGDRDGTNNGDEFNGDIDEVKIYRFALTASDVLLEYNRGKALQLGGDLSQAESYCPPGFTGTCDPPVGEWKFDEYSGTTAYDTSANANNGTITNATWKGSADCKYGSCLSFDGSGDYVDAGTGVGNLLGSANKNISASLWFKNDIIGVSQGLFSIGTAYAPSYFRFYIYGNDIRCNVGSSWSGFSFTDSSHWHHIVATYDGSSAKLYLDTVKKLDFAASDVLNFTNQVTTLGMWYTGLAYLDGTIDDVMVFNRVLSASEIAWLYNKGKPVGAWKFDEGEGSTAKDSSVNNLSGTIIGATWSTSGKYNSALNFDGTDDVVTVTNNAAINMTSKPSYSVCGWLNPDTDGEADAGRWWSKGNSYVRVDTESAGTVKVSALFDLETSGSDASLTTTQTIPIGSWSHICTTWKDDDDDELTIYINGVSAGSSTNGSGAPATDSNSLLIGGSTGANFDGKIDEVKIFNYELSSQQVKIDYNQGASVRFGQQMF